MASRPAARRPAELAVLGTRVTGESNAPPQPAARAPES